MSYYRNTYLKSEHWWTLRVARLAKSKAKCLVCTKESISNDVHHIRYRNLWDVKVGDLRVMCRQCHTAYHRQLDENPLLKGIIAYESRDNTGFVWRETIRCLIRQYNYNRSLAYFVRNNPFAPPLLHAFKSGSPSYISAMLSLFEAFRREQVRGSLRGHRRKRKEITAKVAESYEVHEKEYFDHDAWQWKRIAVC